MLYCQLLTLLNGKGTERFFTGSPHHWCTLVRDMHVVFRIPYIYDYITKLCGRQAKIIHNDKNENLHNIGQDETPNRKNKRLKLGGGHV
jgi:hypothetical protein